MAELRTVRIGLVQREQKIVLHVRIGVFVDRHTRGRMRTVDGQHSVKHAALPAGVAHLVRDVDKALFRGFQTVFVQHGSASLSFVPLYHLRTELASMKKQRPERVCRSGSG